MLRVLIKIAVAALLIHGVWRVGSTFWRYYQFEDALQEVAQFGDRQSERQLCNQSMDKAATLDVPIAAGSVSVRRGVNPPFNCETGFRAAAPGGAIASKIYIEASYHDQLQFLPGYRYPWDFAVQVSAFVRP